MIHQSCIITQTEWFKQQTFLAWGLEITEEGASRFSSEENPLSDLKMLSSFLCVIVSASLSLQTILSEGLRVSAPHLT